MFKYYWHIK